MRKMVSLSTAEIAEIKRVLSYDPVSGVLTWRAPVYAKSRCRIGSIAGRPNCNRSIAERARVKSTTYIKVSVGGRVFYGHHLACVFMLSLEDLQKIICVDHFDDNGCNNAWSNLRRTSNRNNSGNARSRTNLTGFRGVSKTRSGKFRAMIAAKWCFGRYDTAADASRAYVQGRDALGFPVADPYSHRNPTGFRGVYPRDGRFAACWQKWEILGTFPSAVEAYVVYKKAARSKYGTFARV